MFSLISDAARLLMALALLMPSTDCLLAQTNNNEPAEFHFKTIVEAAIFECDILGNRVQPSVVAEAPAHAVFAKIGETDDNMVIIRFWRWSDASPEKQALLNFKDTSKKSRKYFLMSKADFTLKTIQRYSTRASFAAGTIVVPVKARFDAFDFSTDTHLGPSAGVRYRLSPYTNSNFFNAVTTFGVSTVGLDSLNTEGRVQQTSDRPALTFSIGGVLVFSNAQIGLFMGWDFISRNTSTNWVYQGKPWISIGLGYSILSQDAAQQPGKEGSN